MMSDATDAYESLMQFLYQAPIGLVQTSLAGDIEMINPMSARLLMPLATDYNLDNLFDVLDSVAPQLRQLAAEFNALDGVVCDGLRIALEGSSDGQLLRQVLSFNLFKMDASRLMVTLSDVTLEVEREQQGIAQRLQAAARIDSLTQMPNRTAVRERVQHVLDRAAREPNYLFAVLFMNCDRFKQINDTLGSAAGDQVLNQMADRLAASLRSRDHVGRAAGNEQMAARIGGDEFVVVLDDLRLLEDVHAIADRILGALAKPYVVDGQQLHCAVSMGIVQCAQAKGDADAVLQDASISMVEAKRAGGHRYMSFDPEMQERAARRGGTEVELRRALLTGELFVVYQPVVNLRGDYCDGRSAGVEALVRWRHATRGLVPPLEFIGVAEECGLIGALGNFVLATACREFMHWRKLLGPRAPRLLAVNLSRAQLYEPGLIDEVRDILRATGMPPECLQLEVTESVAAQDEAVQARLLELKALRLTLALDDFGTGYSSLASLHQLPVDTIKIDRSFVSQADTSAHHRVLIEASLRVASSLKLSTVAEGIETESQAAVVRELGCDKGQGYLFSKPLTAADLMAWLTHVDPKAA